MPRVLWLLHYHRPCVHVTLTEIPGGRALSRILLADSGAGSATSAFQLILDEDDCLVCGGVPYGSTTLRGAFAGVFPLYDVPIRIPALGYDRNLRVVAVQTLPPAFDGIACFSFLNRFTYGNFGDTGQFGLEC